MSSTSDDILKMLGFHSTVMNSQTSRDSNISKSSASTGTSATDSVFQDEDVYCNMSDATSELPFNRSPMAGRRLTQPVNRSPRLR